MADHRTCKGNRQASDRAKESRSPFEASSSLPGRSVWLSGVVRGDGAVGSARADGRTGIPVRGKRPPLGRASMWRAGSAPGQVTLGGCRPRGSGEAAQESPACGHGVQVNHADGSHACGSWTKYCPLNTLPRMSGWIDAGAVVGQVGSTGRSTGPHAHVVLDRGRKEDDHVEYFDHTSDRPADSQLNEGGC